MSGLEDIVNYQMTDMEAKAFKVGLMFTEACKKECPTCQICTFRRKGDPRKSILFKYSYKLVSETNGYIQDAEYKLYVSAQVQVLCSLNDGHTHAMVSPQCLIGERAWKRWKFWKAKYDIKLKQMISTPQEKEITPELITIKTELTNTRRYLAEKLGENFTYDNVKKAVDSKEMLKWHTFGKVSAYYLILSPWINRALDGERMGRAFLIDTKLYIPLITKEAKQIFVTEFINEVN